MKKDLGAFDQNFFEELEDLKYNYQEAVKRNVQYEEKLNGLAKQYGFSINAWYDMSLEANWQYFLWHGQ